MKGLMEYRISKFLPKTRGPGHGMFVTGICPINLNTTPPDINCYPVRQTQKVSWQSFTN